MKENVREAGMLAINQYVETYQYHALRAGVMESQYEKLKVLPTSLVGKQLKSLGKKLEHMAPTFKEIELLFHSPGATVEMWDNYELLFGDKPFIKEHVMLRKLYDRFKRHLDKIITRLEVVTGGTAKTEEEGRPGSEDSEGTDSVS